MEEEIYENYPEYFEENKIRYEQILIDLKSMMTDKVMDYSIGEAVILLMDKYEIRNAGLFSIDACNMMIYTFYTYYKDYLEVSEGQSASTSSISANDLQKLRKMSL